MRVAIVKSEGYIDKRILRTLANEGINGDIITKFTRASFHNYDSVIFTYQNNIPNMPKVLEQIVLEKKIHVIYITNTVSIGQFYNLADDIYFNFIEEHKMDMVLSTLLKNTKKYLINIWYLEKENKQYKDELHLQKLTSKAKRILMSKGLSEADSHRYIISKAMDMRISKIKLVNLIIEEKIDI